MSSNPNLMLRWKEETIAWPSTSTGNRMGTQSPLKGSLAILETLGTAEMEAIEGVQVSDNDGTITRSRE